MQETAKIYNGTNDDRFIQGVKDCIPTLLGYISVGVAFGVVGASSGLTLLEISLMALLVYAGSAQFIMASLIISGTPASVIIFTIFIVNLRHLLMSLTLAPHFTRYSLLRNIGFGSLLTDETFGVAITQVMKKNKLYAKWMDGLNLTAYSSWCASCIGGALLGQWIPDPEKWGLDFAITAMFIALLIIQLHTAGKEKLSHHLFLIFCMVVSMYILMYFVPSYMAVLLSTLIVATIGVVKEK